MKLPIGIQTFSQLIADGYAYVDKTAHIHQMVSRGKYYFLSRPRRFGKSLLVSTLKAAFSGQQSLFKGLYLEKRWDWSVQYPVINISFGGGVVTNCDALEQTLQFILDTHAKAYDLSLDQTLPQLRFRELIEKLHDKTGRRVVILVDEYDKPILDNIERIAVATELREALKSIYSVIKDSDASIQFAFLTGVSKFSKVSLFSGVNNLQDITFDKRYAEIGGYTEDNIKIVFADYLDGVDFDELRHWYNGYNFLGNKVYNPYDVLLYLDSKEFKNYWFETGSSAFLIKLIQARQTFIPALEHMVASDEVLGSFDVDNISLETLLLQSGYLTIERVDTVSGRQFYQLGYPNREVKSSLTNSLLDHLTQTSAQRAKLQISMYQALEQADFSAIQTVFTAFFASIPHHWYRKNQLANYEGYYASIFYCYFTALGLDTITEDATNQGQIDLLVKLRDKVYVIEFKLSAKGDANTALQQIKDKKYHEKYQLVPCVFLVGVAFDPLDRNIKDFVWEAVGDAK